MKIVYIFLFFFPIHYAAYCSYPQSFAEVIQASLSERTATRKILEERIKVIDCRIDILQPYGYREQGSPIGKELNKLFEQKNILLMAVKYFSEE